MRFHWLIGAAALVLLMQISPSAAATLMGATVQSASYLNVSSPPLQPRQQNARSSTA
jgi:hypothetical protein